MKYLNWFSHSCGLVALAAFTAGCGSPVATPKVAGNPPPAAHSEHDGHDHSAHAHPEEGPHHGQLIELGKEEFHLELTHDDATHTVAIYVLDSAAKASVPIAAKELSLNLVVAGKPVQFSLPAMPQKDDAEGKSSCFQLADEKLCEGLDAKDAKGRINLTINDKPYSGNIEHHSHEEHDHK